MIKKLYLAVCLLTISLPVTATDPMFLTDNPLSIDLKTKGIYGEDDRKEYFQVHPMIKKISESVPAFIFTNQLTLDSSGQYYQLKKGAGGIKTCKEEAFSKQPQIAFCSGFVINDKTIASAGHCMVQDLSKKPYEVGESCENISIVFGYQINTQGRMPERVPVKDVYRCKKILAKVHDEGGDRNDYAVLEVDRTILDHPPLPISGDIKIADNESVGVIGYPYGLPMKITGGATVRNNEKSSFFTTDLDTFGGNSGSPVFNTISLLKGEAKVEGLLVRGDDDFVQSSSGCYLTNKCTIQDAQKKGCRGEDVTRISKVKKFAKLIYSRPAQKGLQITTRQENFKLGEKLKIDLQIPEAGYLNVIEVNPQGQYTLLFPNGYEQNNHVKAGNMTLSDAPDWQLEILSGPFGKHRLYAVLSKTPVNLYQKKSIELQGQIQKFAPSSVKDLMSLTRGAGAVPSIMDNCHTKGAGATARCQDKPQVQSTQVCYYQNLNDCR